jgi:hypothetical protein
MAVLPRWLHAMGNRSNLEETMSQKQVHREVESAVLAETPRRLNASQLEAVVGGFSASGSGSKWGPSGGKSKGGSASAG